MAELPGSCHCGAIAARFASPDAEALEVRACQCSFCRRHGAKTFSDPKGRVVITADPEALGRYRFNLGSADFLVCRRCGAYAGAMIGDGRRGFATLNAVGLAIQPFAGREAKPVVFDAESAEARLKRRQAAWTPAEIVDGPPARG